MCVCVCVCVCVHVCGCLCVCARAHVCAYLSSLTGLNTARYEYGVVASTISRTKLVTINRMSILQNYTMTDERNMDISITPIAPPGMRSY